MHSSSGNQNIPLRQVLDIVKQDIDLKHFLFVLWRRKWWFFIPVVLITVAGVVYAIHYIRPVYEASAMIRVAQKGLLNTSMRQVMPGTSVDDAEQNALARKLRSSEYLLKLARRLDLVNRDEKISKSAGALQARAPWTTYDQALEALILKTLQQKIIIGKLASEQGLYRVFAKDDSPKLAYDIVNYLVEIFMEESNDDVVQRLKALKEESDAQMKIYQEKIAESAEKLRQYQQHLAVKRAQGVKVNEKDIDELRNRKSAIEAAIADKEQKLKRISDNYFSQDSTLLMLYDIGPIEAYKAQIDQRLNQLEVETDVNRREFNSESTVEKEINLVRKDFWRELKEVVPSMFPGLDQASIDAIIEYNLISQVDVYFLQKKLKIVDTQLNSSVRSAVTEPSEMLKLQNLEDELEQNRRIYSVFLNQSRGSIIEESLQHRDAEFKYIVVEYPRMPIDAVAGSKRNFVILALCVGMAIGLALVYARENFDQTIRDVEDVTRYLNCEVWGIVPKLNITFNQWVKSLPQPKTNSRLRDVAIESSDHANHNNLKS